MTPDRLRAWVGRSRVGAAKLQLRHMDVAGGEGTVFQRWSVETLPEDHELVQLVFDVAGDYADSIEEAARVAIEFCDDEGEVLAVQIHKAKTREAKTLDAANADGVSTNGIVSQLLRHIEVQQRVLSGSSLGAFQVLERALTLQTRLMEKQAAQIQSLADQVVEMKSKAAEVSAETDVEALAADTQEESRARAKAYERFSELVPHVAGAFLQWMQVQAAAKGGGAVNGVNSVHATASVGES